MFWLQAVLAWVISLPLLVLMQVEQPSAPRLLDALGACLFTVGFAFEAIADAQMARFRAWPSRPPAD